MSADPHEEKIWKFRASECRSESKEPGSYPCSASHISAPAVPSSVNHSTPLSLELGLRWAAPETVSERAFSRWNVYQGMLLKTTATMG